MPDTETPVYAVLLAGGVGSRLWPVSRDLSPKQLVKFFGRDSLIQATVKRLLPVTDADNIRIVCGQEHREEITRHLQEIGLAAGNRIISEPCGRNTAPAILLAVLKILQSEKEAVLCVFPADHVIKNAAVFRDRLRSAISLADTGYVVTFGMTPHYPETGYGYIEGGDDVSGGALITKRFVEKPDLATARRYLEAGNFFWNSGMFAFRAAVILEEFKRYQPDLLHQMMEIDLSAEQFEAADYIRLPDISIDYAIMERSRKGAVLPSDFGWSDIGSWKALYEFLPKDKDNNVIDGDVIAQETRNCFIMSHGRLIASNHLDNLAIVETPDSIFVSDIDTSRNVKSIVARLKDAGRTETIRHRTIDHAWGSLTVLDRRKGGDVTRLIIRPEAVCHSVADQVCSLTVLEGTGRIGELKVKPGSTFTAAAGEVLQVENRGGESMVVIRVALSQHE